MSDYYKKKLQKLLKNETDDTTLEILKDQAIIQAQAGADIIAPSDMMD